MPSSWVESKSEVVACALTTRFALASDAHGLWNQTRHILSCCLILTWLPTGQQQAASQQLCACKAEARCPHGTSTYMHLPNQE